MEVVQVVEMMSFEGGRCTTASIRAEYNRTMPQKLEVSGYSFFHKECRIGYKPATTTDLVE